MEPEINTTASGQERVGSGALFGFVWRHEHENGAIVKCYIWPRKAGGYFVEKMRMGPPRTCWATEKVHGKMVVTRCELAQEARRMRSRKIGSLRRYKINPNTQPQPTHAE